MDMMCAERRVQIKDAFLHAWAGYIILSSLLLSSQELSDTHVYEPQMRALLGTARYIILQYLALSQTFWASAIW